MKDWVFLVSKARFGFVKEGSFVSKAKIGFVKDGLFLSLFFFSIKLDLGFV